MNNGRLVGICAFIWMLTLMLVGAVTYFLIDKVPEFERRELRRVGQEYRELAVEAKESGKGATFDFAAAGLKRGALKITKEPWGYGRDFVWYFKDGTAYRLSVEPVEKFNFKKVFYPIGASVSLLFVLMTAFGVRYFWKFVKSRDDFLAATAHDLTTPLVGMRMTIGRSDEEAKNLVERMLILVGNLKDFLMLGGRRRPPELKLTDLVARTKEAYSLFAADYADSAGGAVEISDSETWISDAGGRLMVMADETMLMQILWNLFGNDLKYAAPYGKVSVKFRRVGNLAAVEFVDEGQGMTPYQMRHAFDRYYRAKTVLESGKGGFGIGLCTARDFARTMGGNLSVRANNPNGCIFTLQLKEKTR